MSAIEIEWFSDDYGCEQLGCAGGPSKGARVTIDGQLVIGVVPNTHDHDGKNESEVYKQILRRLGHKVSEFGA